MSLSLGEGVENAEQQLVRTFISVTVVFYPKSAPFLPYPANPSLLIICDFLCPSLPPSLTFSPALSLSSVRADHVTLTVNFALFVGETQVSVSLLLSNSVCFSLPFLFCVL